MLEGEGRAQGIRDEERERKEPAGASLLASMMALSSLIARFQHRWHSEYLGEQRVQK